MIVDDPADNVGDVGPWFDAAELAGFDQRGRYCPVLAAAIGACEEGILPAQRNRAD